jgi:nodulation protein E
VHRVVVTGLGCVTPIGSTVDDFRRSLFSCATGIAPIESIPEANGPSGLRFIQMAQIRDFDPVAHLSSGTIAATDRTAQFALVAAKQAVQQSQLTQHHAPHRMAAILGCSTGGRITDESEVAKLYTRNARLHPLGVIRAMSNSGASQISIDHGITGPVLTLSTACASGTHAIGLAFHMIRSGMVDAAIAGGHEAPLSWAFLRSWDSMRVVSLTSCRPFSADRDGMTLGEGAAILTLETLASAQARNAPIFAEIVGFGMSSDATHITNPAAEGAAAAMRAALIDSLGQTNSPALETLLDQVGYINAHGTGTQANDSTEAAAIHQLFGSRAAAIPISSTKSLHGHSIGATGAIEALATILSLCHGRLPATAGTIDIDPTLDLDVITNQARIATPQLALSNSLAFGGLNAVLALRPPNSSQ